jgi:hypothetical protein
MQFIILDFEHQINKIWSCGNDKHQAYDSNFYRDVKKTEEWGQE